MQFSSLLAIVASSALFLGATATPTPESLLESRQSGAGSCKTAADCIQGMNYCCSNAGFCGTGPAYCKSPEISDCFDPRSLTIVGDNYPTDGTCRFDRTCLPPNCCSPSNYWYVSNPRLLYTLSYFEILPKLSSETPIF